MKEFFKKNKTAVIVIAIVIIIALTVYFFWDDLFPPKVVAESKDNYTPKPTPKTTGSSSNTSPPVNVVPPSTAPLVAGDSVVANRDMKGYSLDLNTVVREYKKDDYIGVISRKSNDWFVVRTASGQLVQVPGYAVKRFIINT